MNAVRNKDKANITILGGDCCVPRAVLTKDNTMTMRVNDVSSMIRAGANDKMVSVMSNCNMRDIIDPPVVPRSRVNVSAKAMLEAPHIKRLAAINLIFMRLKIGNKCSR